MESELECPTCNGSLKREYSLPMIAYRCWQCKKLWWNNGKFLTRDELDANMRRNENGSIA